MKPPDEVRSSPINPWLHDEGKQAAIIGEPGSSHVPGLIIFIGGVISCVVRSHSPTSEEVEDVET